jgi:hypothetical protein
MRVGIDFDNTIVCYDDVFYKAALEKGLVSPDVPRSKGAVRDYLRSVGREDDWTELQGYIYGARMDLARPFPGALEFMARCRAAGIDICIISHKTRAPFMGPPYDLHAAAYSWLEAHGVFDGNRIGLDRSRAFFELTKDAKIRRIAAERRTIFIDDLPEFLAEVSFPRRVRRILFDPNRQEVSVSGIERLQSWSAIAAALLDAADGPEA